MHERKVGLPIDGFEKAHALKFRDGFIVHSLLNICLAEERMCHRIVRVEFEHLLELVYGLIVPARIVQDLPDVRADQQR